MSEQSAAWPHGDLQSAFPEVFYVVGTNKTRHVGIDLQTSRTMTVLRQNGELTLVNTVRLDEGGLRKLDALGRVRHIVRLGAFHGRDDAFYHDHYGAALWGLSRAVGPDDRPVDRELVAGGEFPAHDGRVFVFETARFPEAALLLPREGGILITCDAVQNWTHVDRFFSEETGALFRAQGLIGPANIPSTWRGACQPDVADFRRLIELPFRHLITGHGEPLREEAKRLLEARIEEVFQAG